MAIQRWKIMDKIAGKLYWAALLLVSAALYSASGSIALRLTTMQHDEIKEVAIGQPFVLEVILKGDAASQDEPIVENLNAIFGRRLGYQMSSINGNATITYTYKARIDKEGEYVVGPVLVGNYKADPLAIKVGKAVQLAHKKNTKKQKALLHFYTDAHDVVVNEKITCRLRFLFNDSGLSLKHIGQQDIPGFTQSAVEGPAYGTQEIKGRLFNYAEWHWSLCAKKPGNYIIPAHYADFFIKKNNNSFWGSFAQLLDDHDVKRVYSNAEKITVHSHDCAPSFVCAVGKDVSIKASVDSAVVKQSEGMVLRLDITGDSESTFMGVETLSGMPEELKWYRSNTIKLENNGERTEFVIQGLKSGDYEIPPQKLCYFDRASREYVSLQTEPLIISITPLHDTSQQNHTAMLMVKNDEGALQGGNSEIGNQLPLSKSTYYLYKSIEPIPWWVFILILLASGAIVMRSFLTVLVENFFYGNAAKQSYKNAFSGSLYAIKNAQSMQEPEKLYAIFMHLFAVRCAIPLDLISCDRIQYELSLRCVDEEIKIQLSQFLAQLEEAAFGARANVNASLFLQAREWIDILKKIV